MVLVHESAQTAKPVGLEPAFQREVVGQGEIVGIGNLNIIAAPVEDPRITHAGHRRRKDALSPIGGAQAAGGVSSHVVNLPRRQAGYRVAETAGPGAMISLAEVVRHFRMRSSVPDQALRDGCGSACGGQVATALSRVDCNIRDRIGGYNRGDGRSEHPLRRKRAPGEGRIHGLHTPIIGCTVYKSTDDTVSPTDASHGRNPAPAVRGIGHRPHHIRTAGIRPDAQVVGQTVCQSLAISGGIPGQPDGHRIGSRRGQAGWRGGHGVDRYAGIGIAVEARHAGRAVIAGQQDVEASIIVIVAPRHGAVAHVREGARLRRECAVALIAVEIRGNTPVVAAVEQVEVPVIVVITPGDVAVGHARQVGVDLGERAVAVVMIDDGRTGATIEATDGEVEISIVVIVAPGTRCVTHPVQAGVDVGEGAVAVVVVNFGGVGRAGVTSQQNIEIAVIVVVAPFCDALLASYQSRIDVGEDAAAVVAVHLALLSARIPRHQDVEFAVVVVVAPRYPAAQESLQAGIDVGERTIAIVTIDACNAAASRVS